MLDKEVNRLSNAIKEFILNLGEERFSNKLIDTELEITTRKERGVRRQTLFQLKQTGLIESISGYVGLYRIVDGSAPKINWQNADPNKILNTKFPFALEKYFIMLPKNVGIVAGEKDAGKTAFLMNFAYLNQDEFEVVYFSSEMGELELRRRLDKFDTTGLIPIGDWKVDFIERDTNFADVIRPNAINLIDFLEIYKDYFEVGALINQIYRRLNNGIAIIGLQKNRGSEWGLGKERGLEKARFYLTMGEDKLKIKSAKNWARENVNPVGKEFNYKLVKGAKFIQTNKEFDEEQLL